MSSKSQGSQIHNGMQPASWPDKMKISLAHRFLGVSHAKLTSLVNTGVIPHERDPLDHRVKLVRKSDLEKFKLEREEQ
jgi:hypothetical protein